MTQESTSTEILEDFTAQEYKYGFYTDIETESTPPGLNEDIIATVSRKKNAPQRMLEWRL